VKRAAVVLLLYTTLNRVAAGTTTMTSLVVVVGNKMTSRDYQPPDDAVNILKHLKQADANKRDRK